MTNHLCRPCRLALFCLMLLACCVGAEEQPMAFFESKIRPALVDNCYKCHSSESEKVKGGLRVDFKDGLLKGGATGPAIVPGNLEKSLLIQAIRYGNDETAMPPKKKLTPETIADFEHWVKMGAPDPRLDAAPLKHPVVAAVPGIDYDKARQFWSFKPPVETAIPVIEKSNEWGRNPIDCFIAARQKEKGLTHAPAAGKRTLIRRATFDLTGLPPTPEEIDAYLSDPAPDAFEKLIERLLDSPRYGERWGRHWLDVVRYADTAGDNSDFPVPQAYLYRNYVIAAFNSDKPYDRFIREQIAGDLMSANSEQERRDGTIGTGLIALSRHFGSGRDEAPVHLTIEDTIDTLGHSVLGLSLSCARCHDHKFDPITQSDYYGIYGIFSSTRYPFPGAESSPKPDDLVRLIDSATDSRRKECETILAPLEAELAKAKSAKQGLEKEIKDAATQKRIVATGEVEKGGRQDFSEGEGPDLARVEIKAGELLEVLIAPKKTPAGNSARVEFEIDSLEGPRRTWNLTRDVAVAASQKEPASASWESPISGPVAVTGRVVDTDGRIGDGFAWTLQIRPNIELKNNALKELNAAVSKAQAARDAAAEKMPPIEMAYAVAEGKAGDAHIQKRGDPKNPGPETPRRFVQVLGGQTLPGNSTGSGRLELAQWLTDPSNPLTARVMVNRIWQHHFGAGLVATPNDFGSRGSPPSNPALLDFLARRFVQDGWSIKKMHTLIMSSQTYRLSSEEDANCASIDPNNECLWKFSRMRLDAECIRDSMLAVCGDLEPPPQGPHPFPPENTWKFTQHAPFTAVYENKKRSVYLMQQRIKKHPFLGLFDGADPNTTTGSRLVSTTPIQALFMMNDPFVHECAARFAKRLIEARPATSSGPHDTNVPRIELAFQLALGRAPSADEIGACGKYMNAFAEKLGAAPALEIEQKVWASLARVLMSENEFVFVD